MKPIGLGARDLASRGGLVPLRARHRYDHQPNRGKPYLGAVQGTPPRWRPAGRLPWRRCHRPAARGGWCRAKGRHPARRQDAGAEGAELIDAGGGTIGKITSGSFGPTVGGPVAMGYVETIAKPGTELGGARCRSGPSKWRRRRSSSSVITADEEGGKGHERDAIHRGSRMASRR